MIEKEDINLNIRDKWDSTPLYYSCLCGHIEIVKYLLVNGAKCEANTFDGERCYLIICFNQKKIYELNFHKILSGSSCGIP